MGVLKADGDSSGVSRERRHPPAVADLAWSIDGQRLQAALRDGTAVEWDGRPSPANQTAVAIRPARQLDHPDFLLASGRAVCLQ